MRRRPLYRRPEHFAAPVEFLHDYAGWTARDFSSPNWTSAHGLRSEMVMTSPPRTRGPALPKCGTCNGTEDRFRAEVQGRAGWVAPRIGLALSWASQRHTEDDWLHPSPRN